MNAKLKCLAAAAVLACASHAQATLVVNGSFEANSASGNVFNPSNATFNGLLPNVTAYGVRQGIDLQTIGTPYGLAPQHGAWKVSPASDAGGLSEQFSMTLTNVLTSGGQYHLSFYIEKLVSGPFAGGTVEIGLSTSATSFGQMVASATAPAAGWLESSTDFLAPLAGGYLTVRVTNAQSSWVGLDNFVLTPVPEPTSVALLATGLGVIGMVARRRRVAH